MKTLFPFFLSLAFVFGVLSRLFAQPVSLPEAELAALKFLDLLPQAQHDNPLNNIAKSTTLTHEGREACHLIELDNGGFVLLSADRRAYPVPAYSFPSGNIQSADMPPAFQAWIQQYNKQVYHAMVSDAQPGNKATLLWNYLTGNNSQGQPDFFSEETGPFLISSWNQGLYYNQMCPEDPSGPGGHCYAGCVATAMGQICYYFRFPETGTGSYSYEHPVYGLISANFENTNYRWNQMENQLSHQNPAVAELLFHLGVSVDMDYGPDGSGMWNHKAAYSLRTHFKYSPETQYLFRDSTSLDWDSVIVAHLDKKIPLYYAGWSVPNINGHAFVCDGYQDDYFHFNWGWGGSYDGYFYLDELTPGGSNFNLAQELIIHCWPDSLSYTYPSFCTGNDTLHSLFGTFEDGSGPLYGYQPSQDCSWLIATQTAQDSVTNINLQFNLFLTEQDIDIVTIYDGPTDQSPVLGAFSGSDTPPDITSSGNKIYITFSTDEGHQYPGWFISYQSITPVWCSGLNNLNDPSGTLSDGSGTFNYHNGTTCMWSISPENAASATIHFTSFDTEEGKDLLRVYDGQTSELLAEYSGTYSPGQPPPSVTSDHGKLFITFSTNSTVNADGWEAYYESTTTGFEEHPDNSPFQVYPNPSTDKLCLAGSSGALIEIRNCQGKVVMGLLPIPLSGCIDISNLEHGLYFITATGDAGKKTGKFIIMP
ncbi:MAG: C10 family peptidase [Bacteroidales bacterium]|nr:C10 family peptidase [Bacteroidales bacterium]